MLNNQRKLQNIYISHNITRIYFKVSANREYSYITKYALLRVLDINGKMTVRICFIYHMQILCYTEAAGRRPHVWWFCASVRRDPCLFMDVSMNK